MIVLEKIEDIVKKLQTRKSKNIIYLILCVALVGWFGFRFYAVSREGNTEVFNIIRNNNEYGAPVNVIELHETDGVLYEPITVKNNRAYVTNARIDSFFAGQSLGDCKIASVSKNLDLDSGMFVIKTAGCSDGLKYAQTHKRGFYVPVSAVYNNVVYVVQDGVAHAKQIVVANQDLQNVLVKSGLQDGDIVVLSNIKDNQKIKIVK